MKRKSIFLALVVVLTAQILNKAHGQESKLTEEQAYKLGLQAYVYAYPLVLMEMTKRVFINRRAPLNHFEHAKAFPSPEMKDVVRPNVDTLYSNAWLDLSREPLILSVPDTKGRYYLIQLLDEVVARDYLGFVRSGPGRRIVKDGVIRRLQPDVQMMLETLGGVPGRLAVCGWSAGGNLAAVVCQMARAAAGPEICGQALITPVTDCDFSRPSYIENGANYLLTEPLMRWFWDHYADPADRLHPKASPLRAPDLSGLPPALVVTAEFDPLRDEGAAYADALAAAGVPARHLSCRGQIHTSLMAVDVILSSAEARAEIATAIRQFFQQIRAA